MFISSGVEADRSSALASGARGTPTIFVDEVPYLGSLEREELREALSPNGEENEWRTSARISTRFT
jgi:hypothetical protein